MGNPDGRDDEVPPCVVRIDKPFWISKTVITNQQFNLFDPEHDSRYLDRRGKDHSDRGNPLNRPEQPVVRVSWERAKAFCDWLSDQSGRRYALPSEAQWEYTCRAGAGSGRAWGAEQMPGSVGEWTRSTNRSYPYMPGDGREDASARGRKVVRGAQGLGAPGSPRDTYRLSYHWWQGVWNVGFRIVCEDEQLGPVEIAVAE
jgi:formylglycine-generating enzyme required for sulfatase activity